MGSAKTFAALNRLRQLLRCDIRCPVPPGVQLHSGASAQPQRLVRDELLELALLARGAGFAETWFRQCRRRA
jgi:hypothetical protein